MVAGTDRRDDVNVSANASEAHVEHGYYEHDKETEQDEDENDDNDDDDEMLEMVQAMGERRARNAGIGNVEWRERRKIKCLGICWEIVKWQGMQGWMIWCT